MAKAHRKASSVRIALLGAETLLGKELEEAFERQSSALTIASFAANGEGNFSEDDGEAIYVEPLEAKTVQGDAAIVIAGTAAGAQKAYELAKGANGHPALIDCTGHLENEPEARIVASPVEGLAPGEQWLLIVAHPAAAALAAVLQRLTNYRSIRQSIAHVFEPASERGKAGAAELHGQTTSLLSFKSLDKAIFDAQLGFNMLVQYGEEAPVKLSSVEQRIERHTATLLAGKPGGKVISMPSIRLIQAPVFHAYSLSLWVEFEGKIDAAELGEALASAQIEVRSYGEEAPNNVGAAGQSGLIAGDIRVDRNNPQAAWFWIVGDNLRLTADVAAELVGVLAKPE